MTDLFNRDEFDFDAWSRLATEDPAEFEARRAELIREMIDQAPPRLRARMQGLQWRLEQLREQSATPIAACIRISRLMWESVLGENGLVKHLQHLAQPDVHPLDEAAPAVVLPFKQPET
jgi:hypothetical protein